MGSDCFGLHSNGIRARAASHSQNAVIDARVSRERVAAWPGSHVNTISSAYRAIELLLLPPCRKGRIKVSIQARYVNQNMVHIGERKNVWQLCLVLFGGEDELGIDARPPQQIDKQKCQCLTVTALGLQNACELTRLKSKFARPYAAELVCKLLE